MKIDIHGHLTAPDSLYVYKAGLVSHRGAHGRGDAALTKEAANAALTKEAANAALTKEAANAALDAPNRNFGNLSSPTASTWTTPASTTS